MLILGLLEQRLSLGRIGFISRGDLNIQGQLGFGIDNQVNLVAEKDIFLILVSPLGITAEASFLSELTSPR
jgi:hypothetical protein